MNKCFNKKYVLYSIRNVFDAVVAGIVGNTIEPSGYRIEEVYEKDGKYYKSDYTSPTSYQEEERKITRYHQYFKNKSNSLAKEVGAKIDDLNRHIDRLTAVTEIGEVVAIFNSFDEAVLFLELEGLTDSCKYNNENITNYLVKYPTRKGMK